MLCVTRKIVEYVPRDDRLIRVEYSDGRVEHFEDEDGVEAQEHFSTITDKIYYPPLQLDRTVFKIQPLSAVQWAEAQNILSQSKGNFGSYTLKVLRFGLVGWDNLRDEVGATITYDAAKPFEMVDLIDPEVRDELAMEIVQASQVGDADRKNFYSPPSGSPKKKAPASGDKNETQ